MRSNKILPGCGIAVIIVLVLAIAGMFLVPSLLQDTAAEIGHSGDTQIFLVQPFNGAVKAVNQPVEVYAEAVSLVDIQNLELWVDNHLWETGKALLPAGKSGSARWVWTPGVEGDYTLAARGSGRGWTYGGV